MANSLGIDLSGKAILIKAEAMGKWNQQPRQRLARVSLTSGFGRLPCTTGDALYVRTMAQGEEGRISGHDVERVVEEEEVEAILGHPEFPADFPPAERAHYIQGA